MGSQSETKRANSDDALARALSQPQVPDALLFELDNILKQTVDRLRTFLHQGELNAYYLGMTAVTQYHASSGPRRGPTDGTMESGIYWPFGRPLRSWGSCPRACCNCGVAITISGEAGSIKLPARSPA
jgi:hypothetical protein